MFFSLSLSAVYKEESSKNYFLRRSSGASETRAKMTKVQRKFVTLQGNSSLVEIRFVVSTSASFLKNRMMLSGLEKSEKWI